MTKEVLVDPPVSAFSTEAEILAWIEEIRGTDWPDDVKSSEIADAQALLSLVREIGKA